MGSVTPLLMKKEENSVTIRYSNAMAEPANAFEPEDLAAKERALEEAGAELAAARGVPHERVLAWLRMLAQGHRTSPPKCG
jgi:hypothetical protein